MTRLKTGGPLAALLISSVLASTVLAQQDDPEHDRDRVHGEDHDHAEIEEVIVQATPMGRDVVEMSQSTTVLRGDALAREAANNLGDTLGRMPGLANASFGQNVGRPVIRGMQGVRVGVLNDNMTSSDASAVSQDHAVPTEPFLADQVEVLRGPATLIYGSGSIGGVVNMVTNTIPAEVPETPFQGRALAQVDSASDQRFAAGRIDFGGGSFAGHASGFYRRTDDYEIPGDAHLFEGEDEDHEEDELMGILENSFLDNEGGALGGSWIGERWRAGLSYTAYDSDYGIPGAHAHEHEEEGHDEEEGREEAEENVTIGLENRRWDALLAGTDPFSGIEQLKLNLAGTDYTHTEFEGAEVGTVFNSETLDLRLELKHAPWGRWTGAFGGQYTDRDFSAAGEEAFVPPSQTDTGALFWIETTEFGAWRLDLGMRYEDVDITARGLDRDFNPFSFSAAGVWHMNERNHLSLSFTNAERAPSDAELFSNGPHIATQTFEVGEPELGLETNRHFEAAWRIHEGPLTGRVSIYFDDFRDYIYQADTGLEEDGLPVRLWSQQDAEFVGGELELRWDIGHNRGGHWQLFGFYDRVRAELDDGQNVPRIPPRRIGLGVDWDHGDWTGNLTWINADDHTRTAEFETPTPGYDLVNAELALFIPASDRLDFEVYLKGHNLLDEDIRHSTSFLKDQAPQIGRNFVLGVRASF